MKISKKEWFLIGVIFTTALTIYGCLALKMECTVFYPGDESLYINLAKSLHFTGTLTEHYQLRTDDDILYPMILSLAYLFYSPEQILNIFRLIGVVLMCSTIFPAYILAKEMNVGKIFKIDGAVMIAILSVAIPEMTYSAYILEEVLLYPLFMWSMWVVYLEFASEDKLRRLNIWAIVLFFAMYITKMFAMVFCCTYCLTLFLYGIVKKDKKIIVKSMISGGVFFALLIGLKLFVYIINGMHMGNAKYSEQVMSIFPITFQVIISLIRGMFFYGSYFILFMGIIPVYALCANFKKFEKKDMLWAAYLLGLVCCTILEIVVIIHHSENGKDLVVSRFHFRYLFYFFVPMFALLCKYKTIESKTIANMISGFMIAALSVFFISVSQNGQGICDGIICYLMKRMNLYTGFSDTLFILLIFIFVILIIFINRGNGRSIAEYSLAFILSGILVIMPLTFKIPIENSQYASVYIEDYIKVAKYINKKDGEIYYLSNGDYGDPIFRSSAYNTKDFKEIWINDNMGGHISIEQSDTILVIPEYFPYEFIGNIEEIELGTTGTRVLKAEKGEIFIDRSQYNITFYSYGNLRDGYDENRRRYLKSGGQSFGPYILLEPAKYRIEVKGDNLSQSQMYAYSGSEMFDLEVIEYADDKGIYELELDQPADNFEFMVRNNSDEIVILDKIKIKRMQ